MSNQDVEDVAESIAASVFKPQVAPLVEGQTRVNLIVPVVVGIRVPRLLILGPTIILSLLLVSLKAQLR